ncbi:RNA polymerase beta subunit [Tanacetum coccineum]
MERRIDVLIGSVGTDGARTRNIRLDRAVFLKNKSVIPSDSRLANCWAELDLNQRRHIANEFTVHAMSTIPGFNQIQFEGFCRFIDQGLTEELSKFPKIEDTNQEIDFELFLERYQLVEPLIKERDAVYESLTYSSELYVSARLIWKNDRRRYIQEQTILIGKIPLMTSLGAFIVNGIYRIVINQILQSPGIYYQSELNDNGISVYTGTIISDWGGRLELEIDRKARIWVRVSRQQKLSILVLLSAMGLNIREILENVCYPELFLSFLNDKKNRVKRKCYFGVLSTICLCRGRSDLLQEQFGLALVRLENMARGNIYAALKHNWTPTPQNLVNSTPLTDTYKVFFRLHPLSQVLDQTNPLTQIVHGRKLSYLGPGGLTARTATFPIRDIHPSHYGRICPIDTSEGINVGLIGSLAIHAKIGRWGSLESPFYKISERSKGTRMLYLSPGKDEYYMVAAGNSLALNQGIQEEQVVPARYRQEFLTIAWEQGHLRSIFSFQYFSIGDSLIPFIEHNDANRALMSSNMQRQAVPLSRSEKCIVGTGLEGQATLDSGALPIAEHEGKIIYTDTDKILLLGNGDTLSIPLIMYQRSNKNTCMHQKPQVQLGKCIKKGQILAYGAAIVDGELALGKNVLVAYMPWEDYNFEDAVLISERLVYEDIYTSFHIRKYEIQINQGSERVTNEIPHLEVHLLRNLDKNGIVMLGSWVETGDILVGKLTPQMVKESSYAPEDRLLRTILGMRVYTSKETCLKLPIGGRGRVIDVRWVQSSKTDETEKTESIRVYILQKREIKVGDKVAGRHGNKGIISKILPRQDMPYLQDGRPVDMVFNPLGVPSRMNVGQIFESSLGLAGDLLDRHYRIAPFDERYEQEASRKLVFSELYEASKQTANPWIFEPESPGKSRIFDGRTGDPFEQPVIIGKPYILKLIHQVDDKIHGRSSGRYSRLTQQPLKGRAKKGGQRVGEMEVWALEGFGVAYILQEMLTYKSDHIRARQEVLGTIIFGGRIPTPEDAPESFRLFVRELRSLALELNHFLVSEKTFQLNRKEA